MKFFQILFLVCAAVSYIKADGVDKEQVHKVAEECKAEVGASDDDVVTVLKHQPTTTDSEKCLFSCMLTKMGIMEENGHLNKEKLIEVVSQITQGDEDKKKLGEEIANTCSDIEVPENHCEAAGAYNECMIKSLNGRQYIDLS